MSVPRADGSTISGSHRSTSSHGQPPSGRTSGDPHEYVDGKPLAQFWAQVAVEQRTKVGTALRAVRQEMSDDHRPCASQARTLHTLSALVCSCTGFSMLLTSSALQRPARPQSSLLEIRKTDLSSWLPSHGQVLVQFLSAHGRPVQGHRCLLPTSLLAGAGGRCTVWPTTGTCSATGRWADGAHGQGGRMSTAQSSTAKVAATASLAISAGYPPRFVTARDDHDLQPQNDRL